MPNLVHTWPYHEPVGYLVMAACLGSFFLACTVSPGIVGPSRKEGPEAEAREGEGTSINDEDGCESAVDVLKAKGRHVCYPYDGVVFVEGFCKTCRVPK